MAANRMSPFGLQPTGLANMPASEPAATLNWLVRNAITPASLSEFHRLKSTTTPDFYPAQTGSSSAIPQAMIGRPISSEALSKLNLQNFPVYVIDDFETKDIALGSGKNQALASHGDLVVATVQNVLKGQGKIIPLNLGSKLTNQNIKKQIQFVLDQHKNSADLSHVTINMSLGSKFTSQEDVEMTNLISKFTSRGGNFVIPAGNQFYSIDAAYTKGAIVVDGSDESIGGPVPPNSKPSKIYGNSAILETGTVTISARPVRSETRIAPSFIFSKVDTDGTVKLKTKQGWVDFLPGSKVIMIAGEAPASDLSGKKPSRYVTAQEINTFVDWINAQEKKAVSVKSNQGGAAKEFEKLSPRETLELDINIKAESILRFGKNPVFTLETYQIYKQRISNSLEDRNERANIPQGLSTKDIVLSLDQVINKNRQPIYFQAQYYVVDKNGALAPVPFNANQVQGTSFASPYVAAYNVIYQATLKRQQR